MARLDDGHSTVISFSLDTTIKLYEKEVTPPGLDGGGPNDTTTMRNTSLRTMSPKKLITMTAGTITAAYDPDAMNELYAMINRNQQITVTFPDGATLVFWGWINTFTPNSITEGEQPTAQVGIEPSNQDNSGVEQDFVLTPAA